MSLFEKGDGDYTEEREKNKRIYNNYVHLYISATQLALAANLAFAKPVMMYYTPISKAN